jgi:hypothetical protein
MNIYLRHPTHGTKVAFMEEEAIFDEEHGWTRYTPGEPELDDFAFENQMRGRRRGRKPLNEEAVNDDSGRPD